jgi:hypothetical protein
MTPSMKKPKLTAAQILDATEQAPLANPTALKLLKRFFADPDNKAAQDDARKKVKFCSLTIRVTDTEGRPVRCFLILEGDPGDRIFVPFLEQESGGTLKLELPTAKYKVVARSGLLFKKERVDYVHLKEGTVKEMQL